MRMRKEGKQNGERLKAPGSMLALLFIIICGMLNGCSAADGDDGTSSFSAELYNLRMSVPEGYTESTTGGLYLNRDYPEDQSNLYLYTAQKQEDFQQIMESGQQQFVDYLVSAYEEQYEEAPEVTVARYEPTTVDGYNAYVIELTYELQGVSYHQLEYMIDADRTYFVAFSQVGNYEWMDAFRECAATITFMNKEESPIS